MAEKQVLMDGKHFDVEYNKVRKPDIPGDLNINIDPKIVIDKKVSIEQLETLTYIVLTHDQHKLYDNKESQNVETKKDTNEVIVLDSDSDIDMK